MGTTVAPNRPLRFPARATDTYGMVLLLILLDYLVIATLSENDWGKVCIVFLQGITIWFALSVSRSHRIWQVLAIAYLVLSVLTAIITARAPGAGDLGRRLTILGGLLLLVTPFVISRRIASHMVVSTETVMGAISVYLLIGMSFAYIYLTIDTLIPAPFFVGLGNSDHQQLPLLQLYHAHHGRLRQSDTGRHCGSDIRHAGSAHRADLSRHRRGETGLSLGAEASGTSASATRFPRRGSCR